jgi:hypothetical protein
MTEEDWLVYEDNLGLMLDHAKSRASGRKLRLAACGYVRLLGDLLPADPVAKRAVRLAEECADGLVTPRELAAFRETWRATHHSEWPSGRVITEAVRHVAMATTQGDTQELGAACWYAGIAAGNQAVASAPADPTRDAAWARAWEENDEPHGFGKAVEMVWDPVYRGASDRHLRACCGVLRDVVGNPFCPVTTDPSWCTSTVVSLARGIYEGAFDRMPLLMDALMDAGCADEAVLDHCRGPNDHVRGCWVVDLVLGKS